MKKKTQLGYSRDFILEGKIKLAPYAKSEAKVKCPKCHFRNMPKKNNPHKMCYDCYKRHIVGLGNPLLLILLLLPRILFGV